MFFNHIFMLYPILSSCFAAASYVITKFFICNKYIENVDIVTIMFHTNIINLFIFFSYYFYRRHITDYSLFNFRKAFVNVESIWQMILLGLPVLSSIIKSKITEFIPISTIEVSSMIKPFFVTFLAIFLLKEKFKIKYVFCFLLALAGFYVVNMRKFTIDEKSIKAFFDENTIFIFFYILISSLGNITRRYFCKKRTNTMEAICAEYLTYFTYGTIILLVTKTFSINILFNKYVLFISLLTLSHHFCIIKGTQKAKTIAALELLTFSKTVFTLFFSFILLNEEFILLKAIGAIIILFSILIFRL